MKDILILILGLFLLFGPGIISYSLKKTKIKSLIPSICLLGLVYFAFKYLTFVPKGGLANLSNFIYGFYFFCQFVISSICTFYKRKRKLP